jgi:hypothetical protein
VPWKDALNAALRRTTGLQLTKAREGGPAVIDEPQARSGDRLLERPAFILSSVRSGSTLLRVLLDSHSQLHSPHELHLRRVTAAVKGRAARRALRELELDNRRLRYLLWDRLLHRELTAHGKRFLVNKTPNDVFITERIQECWPDARFVFLLRHPASIARSRANARPQDSDEQNLAMVLRYANALEKARRTLPGIDVRYEALTENPERELRRLCDFLGVRFEPAMLEYDRFDHGAFRPGLGDWTEKIKSGRIQPAAPAPADVPEELRDICEAWGY